MLIVTREPTERWVGYRHWGAWAPRLLLPTGRRTLQSAEGHGRRRIVR